jgi:hypothetical protein
VSASIGRRIHEATAARICSINIAEATDAPSAWTPAGALAIVIERREEPVEGFLRKCPVFLDQGSPHETEDKAR